MSCSCDIFFKSKQTDLIDRFQSVVKDNGEYSKHNRDKFLADCNNNCNVNLKNWVCSDAGIQSAQSIFPNSADAIFDTFGCDPTDHPDWKNALLEQAEEGAKRQSGEQMKYLYVILAFILFAFIVFLIIKK